MQHVEGRFVGHEGIELFRQSWQPDFAPSAVVVLVHGVGEHSGRYDNVVKPLAGSGVAVCSYDQRGHGRSPGRRVHIDRWTEYREDLHSFVQAVADEYPETPRVVYGHSMGSLVVLDYLLNYPDGLAGSVISGVALEPIGVGSPAQVAVARLLTGVLPTLSIDLKIDANSLTSDPVALEAFREDALVTGRATVRWGTESLATVSGIKDGMGTIDLPMLVIHGAEDPLNSVAGARNLFGAISASDKELRIYDRTMHEPHNDLVHEQVAEDIIRWIAHLAESPATSADIA